MPNTDVPLLLKGMTGGVNSERSIMNILPTELEDSSRNVDVLRDGSLRPRRAVDFIGQSDSGNYMHDIRTVADASESSQEAPSGIYAAFTTDDGDIVEKAIIFQDNEFKVFDYSNITNFDSPDQTIDPGSRVGTTQLFHSVQMLFEDNRVFFAGEKLQMGYLYLDADKSTINVVYLSVYTRDLTGSIAESSKVQLNGKYYECIEAHTSAASDLTTNDAFGELTFNRYWAERDNTGIPVGTPTWAASTSYTTNVVVNFSKYSTLSAVNPHTIGFFAGRLWFATGDTVYYSQVAVEVEDAKTNTTPSGTHEYSLCMQAADPFDTDDPDPTAADGGTILTISGKIWEIVPTEDSMYVGTSSNLTEIRGATTDFKHTDFKIGQVLDEGINGLDNMVVAGNRLYVFASNNIWVSSDVQRVSQSALTKFAKTANKKIKDYYINIPKLNKGTARAVYSATKERIYYFHNSSSTVFDQNYRVEPGQTGYASDILIIDVSGVTQSREEDGEQVVQNHVQIWSYEDHADTGGTYLAYGFSGAPTSPSIQNVVVGADTVVVSTDSVIVSGLSGATEGSDEIIIIAMEREVSGSNATIRASLAVLETTSLKDWNSDVTRVTEYTTNADMGTQVFEDVTSSKAARYLLFVLEKLTVGTGSCLARTAFNFSDPTTAGEATGKTSGQTEIYKDTRTVGEGGTVSMANYKAVRYKHKVRGRGVGFQVSLENTPGKDFKLLGWGELMKIKRRQQ